MYFNRRALLNVPVRDGGTIDEKEPRIVEEIGGWMQRLGSATYGTRPWRVFAAGPTRAGGDLFPRGGPIVRYVRKGDDIHALVLGWPDDGVVRLALRSRGDPIGRGDVTRVTVPGDPKPLAFRRTGQALEVTVPATLRNPIGLALTLSGSGLTEVSLPDLR